eukprot:TRINITY_DN2707_c0_g1_i1.p1 TRINITY_DN2707_c0_g1~~TRINITY_DN2707_c0_g1_i1.p1  ORF type:complete len:470 (-),score=174.27 TRINITY_DN2707_c0_g1_i1:17-1426(-)
MEFGKRNRVMTLPSEVFEENSEGDNYDGFESEICSSFFIYRGNKISTKLRASTLTNFDDGEELDWEDYELEDLSLSSDEENFDDYVQYRKLEKSIEYDPRFKIDVESIKKSLLSDKPKKKLKKKDKKKGGKHILLNRTDDYVNLFLEAFESFRNIPPYDQFESKGKFILKKKLLRYISQNLPIELVIPAFPCKSPNTTTKVFGILPDKGEEIALQRIEDFCETIGHIYPPGCSCVIVGDGRVFADIIGVPDETVNLYNEKLRTLINFKYTTFDDLDLLLGTGNNYEEARNQLTGPNGMTLEDVNNKIKTQQDTLNVYRGFIKFLSLDRDWPKDISKNQIKKKCSVLAKEMIRRNHGFSKLIDSKYPNHIRLSIHAHSNAGPKYGVRLIPDMDHCITPWHNVVVRFKNGTYVCMKKQTAETASQELEIIYKDDQPYYYREKSKFYCVLSPYDVIDNNNNDNNDLSSSSKK